MFSAPSYSALETSTNAVITVVRTNGTSGTLSVQYATSDGTATAGSNYRPTNGSLTFEDNGVTSQSFTVPLLYNPLVQGDLTVNLTLSNPIPTPRSSGQTPSLVTIMDANFGVAFAESAYFVNDTNGLLTVGVQRVGNTNGAFTVNTPLPTAQPPMVWITRRPTEPSASPAAKLSRPLTSPSFATPRSPATASSGEFVESKQSRRNWPRPGLLR